MVKSKGTIIKEIKELLSEPKNRIKLDDFVTEHLKKFINMTSLEQFPVEDSNAQKEEFLQRLQKYEEILKDLQKIVILLARWGNEEQLLILEKVFNRIAETEKGSSGLDLWVRFGWYPIQVLMYSSGIAALSARKYSTLKIILTTNVTYSSMREEYLPIIVPVTENLAHIHGEFKWIPGQDRKHVPRSEHFFEILEPVLQELLFLGKDYERLFDDFEVYAALVYGDFKERNWYTVGRFGWKYRRETEYNPFNRIVEEGKKRKDDWLPLQAGMFNDSLERFLKVSESLRQWLSELSWL